MLRRFRDFAWLHQRLYEQNRGTQAPAIWLPGLSCLSVFSGPWNNIEGPEDGSLALSCEVVDDAADEMPTLMLVAWCR